MTTTTKYTSTMEHYRLGTKTLKFFRPCYTVCAWLVWFLAGYYCLFCNQPSWCAVQEHKQNSCENDVPKCSSKAQRVDVAKRCRLTKLECRENSNSIDSKWSSATKLLVPSRQDCQAKMRLLVSPFLCWRRFTPGYAPLRCRSSCPPRLV